MFPPQNLALVKVRKASRAIKEAVEEECLAVNEMVNTARINMREILATYLTEDEKLHLGAVLRCRRLPPA